jgi:ATP-dependent Lhr-like helicase
LLAIIRQLQGFEAPASAWESKLLPARVSSYSPDLLDQLCLSGEAMWGRISPHPAFLRFEPKRVRPTSVAPLTLFLREDADWLLTSPPHDNPKLSHAAADVLAAIDRHGASFFAELVKRTGRLPSEVEDGLWELVTAGLVTADGFENLRALIDPKRRRGEGRGRTARPRHAPGRWARIQFAPTDQDTTEVMAHQLLRRWGVVFRDILRREPLSPPWRELVVSLRRMEARGEIRGGRFLSAFIGEQYALPEAVDLLRSVRRKTSAQEPLVEDLMWNGLAAGVVPPHSETPPPPPPAEPAYSAALE